MDHGASSQGRAVRGPYAGRPQGWRRSPQGGFFDGVFYRLPLFRNFLFLFMYFYCGLGALAGVLVSKLILEPNLKHLTIVVIMLFYQALFLGIALIVCRQAKRRSPFGGGSFGAWVAGFSLAYLLGIGLGLFVILQGEAL